MGGITKIVDQMLEAMEKGVTPAQTLPPILLKCITQTRPGLSAYKTTTEIIMNNKKIGIPTEDNPDGSTNLINLYTYNVVKCIYDALKNEASVQVAIPRESLLIQGNGANAGGPIVTNGTNLLDSLSRGIIK